MRREFLCDSHDDSLWSFVCEFRQNNVFPFYLKIFRSFLSTEWLVVVRRNARRGPKGAGSTMVESTSSQNVGKVQIRARL